MPMPDPLNNIMNRLRGARTVDPRNVAARRARMEIQRGQLGVSPGTTPGELPPDRPPHDQLSATLKQIGAEKADETELVGPQNMIPIIVDQLNETILSLKVQIHREQDQERRRLLEQQAEQLRKQIVDLGGEPIWADESIEEGLLKLRGYGQVGQDRLEQALALHKMMSELRKAGLIQPGTKYKISDLQKMAAASGISTGTTTAPTTAPTTTITKKTTGTTAPKAAPAQGQTWQASLLDFSKNLEAAKAELARIDAKIKEYEAAGDVQAVQRAQRWKNQVQAAMQGAPIADIIRGKYDTGIGQVTQALGIPTEQVAPTVHPAYQAPLHTEHGVNARQFVEGMGAQIGWNPSRRTISVIGPLGEIEVTPNHITPEGVSYADEGALARAVRQVGALDQQVPTPIYSPEYVQQLLEQIGIRAYTDEEIEAHAQAVVQRQLWDMERQINAALARFKENFPNEFEEAKRIINEAAAEQKAEYQEEFAARGLYYSSIMAGALEKVDEETTRMIGEIARDAASYVADLERELLDLQQWAVLETEVLRRQLEAEAMDRRIQLFNIYQEVAKHGDMFALDAYYKGAMVQINQQRLLVDELKFQMDRAERENNLAALAGLAYVPEVASLLQAKGLTMEALNQMPLEMQAREVQSVVSALDYMNALAEQELNNQLIASNIALNHAQAKATYSSIAASTTPAAVPEGTALQQVLDLLRVDVEPVISNVLEGTDTPTQRQMALKRLDELRMWEPFIETPEVRAFITQTEGKYRWILTNPEQARQELTPKEMEEQASTLSSLLFQEERARKGVTVPTTPVPVGQQDRWREVWERLQAGRTRIGAGYPGIPK